jgi:hypothetical protein
VALAAGDRADGAPAQRDGAGLPRRLVVPDVRGAATAELPGGAEAPADESAVVADHARVEVARRDGHGPAPGADVDRPRGGRRLVVADRGLVGVAEPPVGAEAPAVDGAVVGDRARVVVAGHHRARGAARPEVDRRGVPGREHVGLVPVAETAGEALAPAPQGAIREQRAGVLVAGVEVAALGGPGDGRGLLRGGRGGSEEHDEACDRGEQGRSPRPRGGGGDHDRAFRTTGGARASSAGGPIGSAEPAHLRNPR